MVSVNWTWHCNDHNIFIYNSIIGDVVYLFNNSLRDSHGWTFVCLAASDDFSTQSTPTKMVFTRIGDGIHDATNVGLNWNSCFSHFSRDGDEKRRRYSRTMCAGSQVNSTRMGVYGEYIARCFRFYLRDVFIFSKRRKRNS